MDVGVDYLRFTLPHGSPLAEPMAADWTSQIEIAAADGAKVHEIAPQGYRGTRCGHWFYGQGREGWMFDASGAGAQAVTLDGREAYAEARCARIDHQVTVLYDGDPAGFAATIREDVRRREMLDGRSKRDSLVMFEMENHADSLSINKNASNRRMVIYDKSREQGGRIGPNMVRYELRYSGPHARQSWREVVAATDTDLLAACSVATFLDKKTRLRDWGLELPAVKLPTSSHESDEARRVRWLCHFVAPICGRIVSRSARFKVLECIHEAMRFPLEYTPERRALEASADPQRKLPLR